MARTKTHESAAPNPQADANPLLGLPSGPYLDSAMQASQAMLRAMAAMQSEMLGFANTRLREGLEASDSLLECRGDARQAVNLQLDFARRATEKILEEAGKLMAIAAQMTRECWAPLEEQARKIVEHSIDFGRRMFSAFQRSRPAGHSAGASIP